MTQEQAIQPAARPPARRCPNCKTPMQYIEFFDGHRCPACITITKQAAEGRK